MINKEVCIHYSTSLSSLAAHSGPEISRAMLIAEIAEFAE
jgi:hypothetical protein